jgi:hypothetical protein
MRLLIRLSFAAIILLNIWSCTSVHKLNLDYHAGTALPGPGKTIKFAVIPFEDTTWNGLQNPHWVGQANLYGHQLESPLSISYLVTRGVKNEMAAFGYQLSSDEIYSIQINRHDLKTLLKRIPHIHVDFLVGGTINHFFVQQVGRLIAEVEIEAYLIRFPLGEIGWTKKIGHREVRIPYPPEEFTPQSAVILNNLLDKTLKDLFRNSDFRSHIEPETKR